MLKLEKTSSFPGGSVVKNLPPKGGDAGGVGSIPGLGRSPGGGHGNPLQYSCLENPLDRGACGLQSMGSQRVPHDSTHASHLLTVLAHCSCSVSTVGSFL